MNSLDHSISRRKFLTGAAAVAVGGFLAACGADKVLTATPGVTATAMPAVTRPVATLHAGHLVGGCMSPLFVADALGLFQQQGLNVKLHFFGNPGDNIASLVADATDVIHNPFSNTFVAEEKGVDLTIISGSGRAGLEVVARGGSDIKTLDDMVAQKGTGLKVGTLRVDTLELTLFHLLKSKGLSYDDFDMIFFNDLLAMGQSLINGDTDVCSVVQPYAALVVAEADGAYLGNNETAWGIEAPDCVVTMKQQMVDQRPDIVERYVTSILQADDLMTNDFDNTVETLVEGRYYLVPDNVLNEGLRRQPPQVRLSAKALTALEKGVADMYDLGYLQTVTSEQLFDLSILEKVSGIAG